MPDFTNLPSETTMIPAPVQRSAQFPPAARRWLVAEIACALVPVVLFILLVSPYWGSDPDLDAMLFYRESLVLNDGGFKELLHHRSGSLHPPLQLSLHVLLYRIFGATPFVYNFLGLLLYTTLSATVFVLARQFFGRGLAVLASLWTLSSPLLIVNTFYPMSESLIVVGWVMGLLAVKLGSRALLTVALAVLALTKSTGLVFAGVLAFVVLRPTDRQWVREKRSVAWRDLVPFTVLIVFYVAWKIYLASIGGQDWNTQYFEGETGSAFGVILRRLFTLKIFNIYFKQNLQNALVINFHWFLSLSLVGAVWLARKNKSAALTEVMPWLAGTALYALLVLPFPTWSVPRYSVPIVVTMALCVPVLLGARFRLPVLAAGVLLNLVGTYWSVDPITLLIFPRYEMQGEKLYDTDYGWRGPDRAMSNLQLPAMTKRRNPLVERALDGNATHWAANCDELKLGEKLWAISFKPRAHPEFKPGPQIHCLHTGNPQFAEQLAGLRNARVVVTDPGVEKQVREKCVTCTTIPLRP